MMIASAVHVPGLLMDDSVFLIDATQDTANVISLYWRDVSCDEKIARQNEEYGIDEENERTD